MRRRVEERVAAWRANLQALPLLMLGARRAGKAYAVRQFRATQFEEVAYANFQAGLGRLSIVFSGALDSRRSMEELRLPPGCRTASETTLIVFDEAQLCRPAVRCRG